MKRDLKFRKERIYRYQFLLLQEKIVRKEKKSKKHKMKLIRILIIRFKIFIQEVCLQLIKIKVILNLTNLLVILLEMLLKSNLFSLINNKIIIKIKILIKLIRWFRLNQKRFLKWIHKKLWLYNQHIKL